MAGPNRSQGLLASPRLGAALVIAASLLVQAPQLGYPLLWDDVNSLVEGGLGCERPLDCLGAPTNHNYYRPVFAASLAVGWALSGRDAARAGAVMHAENLFILVLELLAALAFFSLAFGAFDFRAVLATGVLGLHPIQATAVAWITGRADTLPTFFALAAFAAAMRLGSSAPGVRRGLWAAGAVVGLALAVFAKEQTALLLLLFPLVVQKRSHGVLLAAAGAALGLGWWLVARRVAPNQMSLEMDWSLAQHAVIVLRTVAHTVKLFVWPSGASLQAETAAPWDHVGADEVALAVAGSGAWLALGWVLRRSPARLFWGWATLTLGPVMNVVPLNTALGPYRLVLPLVGVAGLAATAVVRLAGSVARPWVLPASGAGLLALLALLGAPARGAWASEEDLCAAVLEADPTNFHFNLLAALHLHERGRPKEALTFADAAVRALFGDARGPDAMYQQLPFVRQRLVEHSQLRSPPWKEDAARAVHDRGLLEAQLGQFALAIDDLDVSTRLHYDPEVRQAYVEALLMAGRTELARRAADEILRRDPSPEREKWRKDLFEAHPPPPLQQ